MMLAYRAADVKQFFADAVGKKCAEAKIVPKLPNFEQTESRMDIAREMLTTFND